MCNIDRRLEQQIVAMGLNLIGQAMEASLTEQNYSNSDVLSTATTAYQQGKITKSQFMAVINALDEQAYQTRSPAEPKHPAGNSTSRFESVAFWVRIFLPKSRPWEASHSKADCWNQEYLEAQNYLNQYRR